MFLRHNAFFKDRKHAGKLLATKLSQYKNDVSNTIVLGLPRGGIIVAAEIARELNLPLDLVVPRKIGMPGHDEYAIGALTEDGDIYLNRGQMQQLKLTDTDLQDTIREEMKEAQRRLKTYRGDLPERNWQGKRVIVADDGIATGFTMLASLEACRSRGVSEIIVTVPVMPAERVSEFMKRCSQLVYIIAAKSFSAVGQFYEEFGQTQDQEVISAMTEASERVNNWKLQQQKSVEAATTAAGGEEASIDISESVL